MSRKSLLLFFITFLTINAILWLIPINLFDGEVIYEVNGVTFKEEMKLSLSYFIGIGASPEETKDVQDFYLKPLGYLLAFLICFAFPALLTYRLSLRKKAKTE